LTKEEKLNQMTDLLNKIQNTNAKLVFDTEKSTVNNENTTNIKKKTVLNINDNDDDAAETAATRAAMKLQISKSNNSNNTNTNDDDEDEDEEEKEYRIQQELANKNNKLKKQAKPVETYFDEEEGN
jgi:hypothetical protein